MYYSEGDIIGADEVVVYTSEIMTTNFSIINVSICENLNDIIINTAIYKYHRVNKTLFIENLNRYPIKAGCLKDIS